MLKAPGRVLANYDCGQRMAAFAGIGPDTLLVALVEGWRYLVRQDPRLLHRIVAAQERLFSWPPCPVAGAPVDPG